MEFYPKKKDELFCKKKRIQITPSVCQSSEKICFESRERADPIGAKSLMVETFELDTPIES